MNLRINNSADKQIMKILELRFKNLNSLYGEWFIDFTSPEYIANGIFALTGPTGAGKSTILDAICLALYGATPRLNKITKKSNEIMSRQTGECYAEVLFESQGNRFRCNFSQHRARKKAEADLQNPRHEIAEGYADGKIIESKQKRVAKVVEEKTGMDFERFTRSILLAQGGFDTFLKATTEEKSKILEQITGTGIYSEISRRVHERQREERERLNNLQCQIANIVILEPEEEKEAGLAIEAMLKQENELAQKSAQIGKEITWLTNICGLQKEINNLIDETAKLNIENEAFKPHRYKLEQAEKATLLSGVYATLTALRKQQIADQNALEKENAKLPRLTVSAQKQATALKTSEQITINAKKKLQETAPLIIKVRALDQKISQQAKALSVDEKNCREDAQKIAIDSKTRLKEQEKRRKSEKLLKSTEQYIEEHAKDEWLISGLAGIEEQFGNLITRQNEIKQKETQRENAQASLTKTAQLLATITKQCAIHRQELEDTKNNLKLGKDHLNKLLGGKLLREYRSEKENLLREMAYIKKIMELEDHRARLEDGKPCPLCGSADHPFAMGNVPLPDEVEQKIELLTRIITDAEAQEAVIKSQEDLLTIARKNLNDSEKQESNAINDKKTVEQTSTDLQAELTKLHNDFKELKLAVSQKLQPLGIHEIPTGQIAPLLKSLKSRLKAWQTQISKKQKIEKEITLIDSELNRLDGIIETQKTALCQKQVNLKIQQENNAVTIKERHLYGVKDPDFEEKTLNKAVADADWAEKKAVSLNNKLQQDLNTAKNNIESLKKRIDQRLPELEKAATDFSSALKTAGFADEEQFLAARITNEEREALSTKAKNLDKAQTELTARRKDREIRLATETAKKITDKNIEELQEKFREYEESLKELRNDLAAQKHKLNENSKAKELIKGSQSRIDTQKKECHRWEKLHGLIGSADGKKYRNFAQGLTFELMVSHANRQLQKMTDRYLLIRDNKLPLELNVVDNYQAGEIRSTRNLSGGESFIVSLTLALGLSKMASRKVRIDSLFLDEGFGTLDDEALETALETLSGLQQDGKLIGIISHVSALKERISTRISITPISGGRSIINGPGCNKIQA